jgi:hypothetical protein
MTKNDAIRQAIKDELAVLRVVNTTLRNNATPWRIRQELEVVQAQSMAVLRRQLSLLHPAHHFTTTDTARASARAERNEDE